jgi:long-chain acyl-CoA synthetase
VREYYYRDIPQLSYEYAQALYGRGVRNGDYVAIWAPNSPDWVITCLAALRLGAIVVPLDARSKGAEVLPIIEASKPRVVIAGNRQYVLLSGWQMEPDLVLLDEIATTTDLPGMPQLRNPSPAEPAMIVFTSGSSGASKGVILTHANIVSNIMEVSEAFDVDEDDRWLSLLPLSHMLEFTGGMAAPFNKGATIVYSRLKGAADLLNLMKEEKITIILGTPIVFQTILREITTAIEQLPRSAQLSIALARRVVMQQPALGTLLLNPIQEKFGGEIKFWISGGAPTPVEVVAGLRSFGITLLTGYGLTEASPIVSANTCDANKLDTVGKPIRGVEVRIENPDENGHGEICVRGPNVMAGYFDNIEETSKTLVDDWLHTGDVGILDSDGFLHISGRVKSMIVTPGGNNVFPEELEQVLEQSTNIKEACVFGVHTDKGEEPFAAIVPTEHLLGKPDCDLLMADEIRNQMSGLASYKQLSGWQISEQDLPRTHTGKLRRSEILRMFEQKKMQKSKKRAEKTFEWDDIGKAVCQSVADVMDPAILNAISPSGSNVFAPDVNLTTELALDSFARLALASALEDQFTIEIPEGAIEEAQTIEDLVVLVKCPPTSFAETSTTESTTQRLQVASSQWPAACYKPSHDWPLRSDPMVNTARSILGISVRALLRIYNDFKTEGADRLVIDPPFIVAANHSSHIDTIALCASFPPNLLRLVHPVAAADYFFTDPVRSAFSTYVLNATPFERTGDFESSLQQCEELLRDGKILLIFPEGTRSAGGTMGPLKTGVAYLSIKTGCPIIPAYIDGARNVLPKGTSFPKDSRLKVTFGTPLYPPPGPPDSRSSAELTKRLRQAIETLQAVPTTATVSS